MNLKRRRKERVECDGHAKSEFESLYLIHMNAK